LSHSDHDPAGRPLDSDGELALSSLSDEELAEELTVMSMTAGEDRDARYEQLLAEQQRRQDEHG
jgi:hypothetical protein